MRPTRFRWPVPVPSFVFVGAYVSVPRHSEDEHPPLFRVVELRPNPNYRSGIAVRLQRPEAPFFIDGAYRDLLLLRPARVRVT